MIIRNKKVIEKYCLEKNIDYKEFLYYIKNNFSLPNSKCVICGNKNKFYGTNLGYSKTCSKDCRKKLKVSDETKEKISKSVKEKYNLFSTEKKQNMIKKYKESCKNRTKEKREEISKIASENTKKLHKLKLIPYNKISKSLKESKKAQEQRKQRAIKGNVALREKLKNMSNNELKKYYENQQNSYKKTCLEKYNVDNYCKSDEYRKNVEKYTAKAIETRKKNKTTSSSKNEKLMLLELNKIKNIKTNYQYKCKEYPYFCDFMLEFKNSLFFKELNNLKYFHISTNKNDNRIFIEYQGNWTHGSEPFNKIKHKNILKEWQEKAINSNYYQKAINDWTNRDEKKRNIAKSNNLNYLEIFNLDDFYIFLDIINKNVIN